MEPLPQKNSLPGPGNPAPTDNFKQNRPGCGGCHHSRGGFPLRDCGGYMKLSLLSQVDGDAVLHVVGGLFGGDTS